MGMCAAAICPESIQGGHAKGSGEVTVATAASVHVFQIETDILSKPFGVLVQCRNHFVFMVWGAVQTTLHSDGAVGVNIFQIKDRLYEFIDRFHVRQAHVDFDRTFTRHDIGSGSARN